MRPCHKELCRGLGPRDQPRNDRYRETRDRNPKGSPPAPANTLKWLYLTNEVLICMYILVLKVFPQEHI